MTKNEYWQAHVTKKPDWANEDKQIQLSIGVLRKLMEEAYDKGFEHHKKVTDALGKLFEGTGGNPFERFRK